MKKNWFIDNFELFKSTLNWTDGFPAINRTNLMEGPFRKKFNSFYLNLLNEHNSDLKNKKMIFQNRKPNNFKLNKQQI